MAHSVSLTLRAAVQAAQTDEVAVLRKAAAITAEAHRLAMAAGRPGTFEYELEALIDYTFRRSGGNGPGYGTIVGAGENATILHYVENSCAIAEDDLVLVDAGCEYAYYTADITRTFPASGRFTGAARDVYALVLDVQKTAIDLARPGATIDLSSGYAVVHDDTKKYAANYGSPFACSYPAASYDAVYAFVAPDTPDMVTLVGNWVPLEQPNGGPNFHKFGDDVLYTFQVDNDGDANGDISYEFRFKTTIANPNSFLYNTGQVTALDDPDLNMRQTYSITKVVDGQRQSVAKNLPVAPANMRSAASSQF